MKKFNLTACIAGKPVVTRDGRPYKFAGHNENAIQGCRLLGWITDMTYAHGDDGKYCITQECSHDLFMASEEREVWVNVYPNHSDDKTHWCPEIAKRSIREGFLGTVKLTYRVPEKGEEK